MPSDYTNKKERTLYEEKFEEHFSDERLETIRTQDEDEIERSTLAICKSSFDIILSTLDTSAETHFKASTGFDFSDRKIYTEYFNSSQIFFPEKEDLDEYSPQRFILIRSIQRRIGALDLKPKDKFYLGTFVKDEHINLEDLVSGIQEYLGSFYKIKYRTLQSLFALSVPTLITTFALMAKNIDDINAPEIIVLYLAMIEALIVAGFVRFKGKYKDYEKVKSLVSKEVLDSIYTADLQDISYHLDAEELADFIKNYLVYNLYLKIREHLQNISEIVEKNEEIFSIISETNSFIDESISLTRLLDMDFDDFKEYLNADSSLLDEMPAEMPMKLEMLFKEFQDELAVERSAIYDYDLKIADLLLKLKDLGHLRKSSVLEEKMQELEKKGIKSLRLPGENSQLKETVEAVMSYIETEKEVQKELKGPSSGDFK